MPNPLDNLKTKTALMKRGLSTCLTALLFNFLHAQINISSTNSAYTQNFNTLVVRNSSAVLPTGWVLLETGTNANTTYTANAGATTTGNTYSYGTGTTTERALGALGSSTLSSQWGASFRNNTGQVITSLQISFTGEQWRTGAINRTDKLDMQFSTNATSLSNGTWTDVNELDFSSVTITSVGAKNGDLAANRRLLTHTVNGLNIPANALFFIKWKEFDATGAEDGLAIDDFSLKAGATPIIDVTAPIILSNTPANNSVGNPLSGNLTIAFNETVSKGTGDILIKKTADNSIAATLPVSSATVTITNTQVTIPYAGLTASTSYWVEISAGAFKDLSANNFNGQLNASTWTFTTASTTPVGNSIKVVNWNIEWFGGALGPTDDNVQQSNVLKAMQYMNADIYALGEIVSVPRLQSIVSQLPGYAFTVADFCSASTNATGCANDQKLAFVYKTASINKLNARGMLRVNASLNASYNWSNGRFPYLLDAQVNGTNGWYPVQFIAIHAKANTADFITSYNRRKAGAAELRDSLVIRNPTGNWAVLGDFNDDLDRTITTQMAPDTASSYISFLQEPSFRNITLPLSRAGLRSTVSYPDIIDHVTISDEMNRYYVANSARILRTEMETLIPGYGTTTSDHYPVMTEYIFDGLVAVNSKLPSNGVQKPEPFQTRVFVSGQYINVYADGLGIQDAQFSLINISGSRLSRQTVQPVQGRANVVFPTHRLSKGVYLIQVMEAGRQVTRKVMIR
jgi:endonuclease/exonuclease/phosphatase family metal-dependent hydrolase/methionine-rich copper-binding protein CopC